MASEKVKAWFRLSNESSEAYAAFKVYLDSEERSLQNVANSLHKSRQTLNRWANKFGWKDRAAAYDSSIVEQERKLKIKQRKMELDMQHKIGMKMLDKVMEGLMTLDMKKASPYAVSQMADIGCKILNNVAEIETIADEVNRVTSITIKRAGDD